MGILKSQTISHTEATVSIVDEDIYIRRSLELLVSSQGRQPEACGSAQNFSLGCVVPSTFILALFSSGPNGLEFQKRIAQGLRIDPDHRSCRLLRCLNRCEIKAGAFDFLLKPFSQELMVVASR